MTIPSLESSPYSQGIQLYRYTPQEELFVEAVPSAENHPLEIAEPYRGWIVFEKPNHEGNGNYSIKLKQKNLSDLDMARFKYELNSFSSPSIRHLIIDFSECHFNPYDPNRMEDIAHFLKEKRAGLINAGRVLSLAHLEGNLYKIPVLKFIDYFIHGDVKGALEAGMKQLPVTLAPTNSYTSPPNLKLYNPKNEAPKRISDDLASVTLDANYY